MLTTEKKLQQDKRYQLYKQKSKEMLENGEFNSPTNESEKQSDEGSP